MSNRPHEESLSEAEAQRRFQDALKAGLNTPPKPLKDKPKIRKKAKKSADALIVPSARHSSSNVVLFLNRIQTPPRPHWFGQR
jgi:hypothetical protein